MRLIDRTSITVPERQRTSIVPAALKELRDSILSIGLLHPPVVSILPGGRYQLIAGGRRLKALEQIAGDDLTILCDGNPVLPGQVPVTLITDMSAADLFAVELEENIIRDDLTWEDRTRAIAALAALRREENPGITKRAIAEEIITREGKEAPDTIAGAYITNITKAEALAPHLDDPEISKSRSVDEAYRKLMLREEAKWKAELIRREKDELGKASGSSLSTLIHGDMEKELEKMDEATFDLILTDPPYGMGAGAVSKSSKMNVGHTHAYDDTPEHARHLYSILLKDGFRLTKSRANLFIFTDMAHFEFLQTASKAMGWTPWRWPLIWQKSEAEGLAPWGRSGFIHTFEIIFWATKGQRGLYKTELDILTEKRVGKNDRIHAAEKPLPLLKRLIEISTYPGDKVLDPCMGSGTTIKAAIDAKRYGTGVELDENTYNLALSRLSEEDAEPELEL